MPHPNVSLTVLRSAVVLNAAGTSARSLADSLTSDFIRLISVFYATHILRTTSTSVNLLLALLALLACIVLHVLQTHEASISTTTHSGAITQDATQSAAPATPAARALQYNQSVARNFQTFFSVFAIVVTSTHMDELIRDSEMQHTSWFFSIPWSLFVVLSALPLLSGAVVSVGGADQK